MRTESLEPRLRAFCLPSVSPLSWTSCTCSVSLEGRCGVTYTAGSEEAELSMGEWALQIAQELKRKYSSRFEIRPFRKVA